jgi:hypothetical protein
MKGDRMPNTRIILSVLLCLLLFMEIPSSDAAPTQMQPNKQQNAFLEVTLDPMPPTYYKLTPQYSQAKRPSYSIKAIEKRMPPKPKPIQQIKRGTALVGMSLIPPVLGTVLLCESGGCGEYSKGPLELSSLSLMGTSIGVSSAPFAFSIGSSELTDGLSGFPELKKNDIQKMPTKPGQPTTDLPIRENGQTKNVQIPLEVQTQPVQLKQKIETHSMPLDDKIPAVVPFSEKIHE